MSVVRISTNLLSILLGALRTNPRELAIYLTLTRRLAHALTIQVVWRQTKIKTCLYQVLRSESAGIFWARTKVNLMGQTIRRLVVALLLLASASATAAAPALGDKQQVLWERLRTAISGVEQQLDGGLGGAILDLTTGQQLLVHPDEVFAQASSIKIAVLAELYQQAEQSAAGATGKAKLSDRYVVRASDLVPDSNILGGLTPGVTGLTNRDLATIMVAVSDNSATNVLIDRLCMEHSGALPEAL